MVALVIIFALCNSFVDYRGHMMGAYMERDLRNELFAHLQKLSFRFYDDRRTGQLMANLTSDTFWLSELYHHVPEDIVLTLLKMIGAFAVMFSIDVPLTLVALAMLPVMMLYSVYFNERINRAMRASKDRMGDINAQAEDALGGIRVVQSFANERDEIARFSAANARFVESRRQAYYSEMFWHNGTVALTQLLSIALVVAGAWRILGGSLGAADLLAYTLYAGILVEPIQAVLNVAWWLQDGVTGFDRIYEVLSVSPEIQDAPDARDLGAVRGEITFDRVSFGYKEDQEHVLKDISLTIKAGEYVALVGPSGVGKTTLCALIPRFYETGAGAILLDGVDIRQIRLRALRERIGIVQQDTYLFAGTVAENIGYGKPGAGRAEIIEAAKRASAHDFISALPQGYDTDVGQRGVKLSGGQKQRIAIARVFLKNPPILIFDEATSALDNANEAAIQVSLEQLARERTTLVIAHRLSTIQNAQRILVLGESGIEEQGTHAELLARGGAYARMYRTTIGVS
jgi:ATP-binding cassette subfamily B protein